MNKKILAVVAAFTFTFGFVTACGNNGEVACASVVIDDSIYAKSGSGSGSSSGGSRSSGGSSSGSKSSGGVSGGSSSSKSSTGSKSTPGASSGGVKPGQNGTPKTSSQSSAASSSRVTSKPSSADISKAKAEAPARVTTGGNYYSSVTGNTYVYNSPGYYSRPGYIIDIYDPYNPYNYYRYPLSPFYGRPYIVAADCGDDSQTTEVKNETLVNIKIDSEGKVVSDDAPGTTISGTTPGTTEQK